MFNQVREGDNSVKTSHSNADASHRLQVSMEDMQSFFRNSNNQNNHDSKHAQLSAGKIETTGDNSEIGKTNWSKFIDQANRFQGEFHDSKDTVHNVDAFLANPENIYNGALAKTPKHRDADARYYDGSILKPENSGNTDKAGHKVKGPTDKELQDVFNHIMNPWTGKF